MSTRAFAPFVLGALVACSASPGKIPETPIAVAPPPEPDQKPVIIPSTPVPMSPIAVDEAALDKSVDPCDDFYAYACGGWKKATPIPDDRSSWTRSFSEIDERNEQRLKTTLEAYVAGKNAKDVDAKKLADFYGTCMDENGVEKAGLGPIAPALQIVDGIKDKKDVGPALAQLWSLGYGPLFGFGSGQDFGDATQVIGQLEQGGLGLPDRDYYFDKGAKADEIRTAYVEHVAAMLKLANRGDDAAAIMKFETALATASMVREERREPKKVYHKMNILAVDKLAPTLGFPAFFAKLGVGSAAPINVLQPKFVEGVEKALQKQPVEAWRAYLAWQLIHERAPTLPKAFVDESFRFTSTHLTGAKAQLPRWKRCISAVDHAIGESLGRSFVRDTFGEDGKKTTHDMVVEIEKAMQRNLETLPWMDAATRKKAQEKLSKIGNKIGYPDKFRDYSALSVGHVHASNALAADAFEFARQVAKIGKPLDRNEWYMTPHQVNAYYDANMNEMVFPAGILQAPFFDKRATLATNFGGIGMVMGHELTHGFDDEGRQFDGDGNLKDWWSKKVGGEFEKRAGCLVKQYDGYSPVKENDKPVYVKGKLTLGENLADLGGVKLAYAAFKETRKGQPDAALNGFTEDQQFFLGFAQGWCQNARPQMLVVRVKTDPHSPAEFRVNGPLVNVKEFASAFQCKPAAKMVKTDKNRCEIW